MDLGEPIREIEIVPREDPVPRETEREPAAPRREETPAEEPLVPA